MIKQFDLTLIKKRQLHVLGRQNSGGMGGMKPCSESGLKFNEEIIEAK